MTRILLFAGASLLGGCATVPQTEARLDNFVVCDTEHIAKVESEARHRGTTIRWMRCPQLAPAQQLPPFQYGDRRDA